MLLEESLRLSCVNTLKFLAIDAVEAANSGHPGMPMGCADLAIELFTRHLRFWPADPQWPNRDRFVLSAGHGSMLLYGLLHLFGYDLSLDDLRSFRQLDSKTPGHPESFMTPGVEVTTGPLGQGISNAVGIALASKMMQARWPGLYGYRVFGIASDGDLMEGISHEAASLAGHLGLDNLVFFYDDNHISIDGGTSLALSDDAVKRFESYGWFVQRIDGHDPTAIRAALDAAVAEAKRPSLICARTVIGHGAPNKANSEKAHGSPLGKDEVALTKRAAGWPENEPFRVPAEVREACAKRLAELKPDYDGWQAQLAALSPEERKRWDTFASREVPAGLLDRLLARATELSSKPEATRALAGRVEQVVAAECPWLVGGSADLNPSTNTKIDGSPAITATSFEGRNIHFGVREHAMGAICNGLAASGFVPFGSTFLVFSDYMRPSIRLSALSHLQSVWIFTHDSIFLGEDGPTHQPVEHLLALRTIPHLRVVRPADALECAAAWAYALERRGAPTVLILSRQKLPQLARPAGFDGHQMVRGAYRIRDPQGANLVIVATGSEVHLAIEAADALVGEGIRARVISAPCLEALQDLGPAALDAILPADGLPRVSIEAGLTLGWKSVVGADGLAIGIDDFGASGPDFALAKKYGLTKDAVTGRIRSFLAARATKA